MPIGSAMQGTQNQYAIDAPSNMTRDFAPLNGALPGFGGGPTDPATAGGSASTGPSGAPGQQNVALGGTLPFGAPGNIIGSSNLPGAGAIGSALGQSYQSALAQNQALYNNILGGYNQVAQNLQQSQGPIQQGYTNLGNQVQNTIQGITKAQDQAITDQYAASSGTLRQGAIGAGLGPAVFASLNRGNTLDASKSYDVIANANAGLEAGYQSQIGQAGLNYQNQAAMQQAGQGNLALGWMNTVTAQYPDANQAMQLLANQGAYSSQQDWMKQHPYMGGGGGGYAGGTMTPAAGPVRQGYPQTTGQGGGSSYGTSGTGWSNQQYGSQQPVFGTNAPSTPTYGGYGATTTGYSGGTPDFSGGFQMSDAGWGSPGDASNPNGMYSGMTGSVGGTSGTGDFTMPFDPSQFYDPNSDWSTQSSSDWGY